MKGVEFVLRVPSHSTASDKSEFFVGIVSMISSGYRCDQPPESDRSGKSSSAVLLSDAEKSLFVCHFSSQHYREYFGSLSFLSHKITVFHKLQPSNLRPSINRKIAEDNKSHKFIYNFTKIIIKQSIINFYDAL